MLSDTANVIICFIIILIFVFKIIEDESLITPN